MILASPSEGKLSLTFVEGSLTVIALRARICLAARGRQMVLAHGTRLRQAGSKARACSRSSRHVGARAASCDLPWFPIPLPFVPDDFSFLLGADTFAHGRLTNPTPVMWVHFETIHVDMLPTYMSMYFPGQALLLAAGKVLLGNPWFGVLVSGALMCAGLCWMLQAWLPPGWALLGRHDCGPAPRAFQLLDE